MKPMRYGYQAYMKKIKKNARHFRNLIHQHDFRAKILKGGFSEIWRILKQNVTSTASCAELITG